MIFLSVILLSIGVITVFIDWAYLRKRNRRAFALELSGLATVLLLSIHAEWFTQLAHILGVGRGVDLLMYPLLMWLFREAILGRVRYHRHQTDITELVRHMSIRERREA